MYKKIEILAKFINLKRDLDMFASRYAQGRTMGHVNVLQK
jgi:hypothetical protein